MKKLMTACLGSLLLASAGAQAIGISAEAGNDYVGGAASIGLPFPGLSANAGWGHDNDNNNDAYSLGVDYGFSLGRAAVNAGVKGVYLQPDHGDDGYGLAVGGGVQFPLTSSFSLFGEGYYSPDAFTSHLDRYVEAKGGVRWQPLRPLSVDVGYRYITMGSSNDDRRIADGFYLGAGLSF
ncbi:YfaZ family outer membrane protein [Lonsdalea quercina]|uniref:YfaZ family outer membrane protein n=1 Tax=Lonsdalea quercina TaxID=71657 RepID=UPI00397571AD